VPYPIQARVQRPIQRGHCGIYEAWLGTGLYIAPAISGYEPRYQALSVNVLWVCLLIMVGGSFADQWLA
jgi:nitric oxide reductase subunit B